MKVVPSFSAAIRECGNNLEALSYPVHTDKWQGMNIKSKPEMQMYELLNHSFSCMMPSESLDFYREEVKPNLPWADDHFEERVGGNPLNPGVQWAHWPYATSADRFRTAGDMQFSHTYMERYWPKYAGINPNSPAPNRGYRYDYGDLNDVVEQLYKEPMTRQAFLPVWFPEDTGVKHGGRVPCSIGYHFMMRNGYFHVGYWLRSCDFVRHFRDDIYLTVRLALWVLGKLREKELMAEEADVVWDDVKLGMYSMWMTSLHIFKNDYRMLFGHEALR